MNAGVVEQVLLRVASVRAKVRVGKLAQPLGAWTAFREVQLLQCAFDPHVDREHLVMTASEEQHAVGDFWPNAA